MHKKQWFSLIIISLLFVLVAAQCSSVQPGVDTSQLEAANSAAATAEARAAQAEAALATAQAKVDAAAETESEELAAAKAAAEAAQAEAEAAKAEVEAAMKETEMAASLDSEGGETRVVAAAFQDPAGLNPLSWAHGIHWDIMPMLYDALFFFDENQEIESELVESYTVSDDGRTYTMKLREGVLWHDGEEFTAEDVEFTILAWFNPMVAHYMGTQLSMLAGSSELLGGATIDDLELKPVEVVDKYSVRFNLNAPSSAFVAVLSNHPARIVPKHAFEGLEPEEWLTAPIIETPVGTGPFKFVEHTPGTLTLGAFENYYQGQPKIDELVFRTIPETAVQAQELLAGSVDYIRYPPETMYETLRSDPKIETLAGVDTLTWRHFRANLNNPILADIQVRQALQHALDRNEIVEALFRGNGSPSTQPMAPGTKWYNPVVSTYPYDLEQAGNLLADAGWTPGSDGVLTKDGQRFEIDILTVIVEDWVQVCVYAQEQFRKLGIEATVTQVDQPTYNELRAAAEYDLIFGSKTGAADPAPGLFDEFHSAGGQNTGGYSNSRVDELTELLQTSVDEQERLDAMAELMELVTSDLAHIFVYHPLRFYAFSEQIDGLKFNPQSTHVILFMREAELK